MTKAAQIKKLKAELRKAKKEAKISHDITALMGKKINGLRWALAHGPDKCFVNHDCSKMFAAACS